ncbi:transcription regulator hth gntr [Lucifera butyrica]|uniref:Transcription regulator hth gntr n=1 Tax=Lucifera butyrica TaxID=1351585 RepID=A0A498R7J4_9FIRM|nr:GntR family transcriptional regulator [Lucifera butyrica]VBB07464.1 transcription regulator hth gntr [Lucifera butyrica]
MKYAAVYKDIKRKILNGIYTPWAPLEGEEMLCGIYGISRTTVRKAIAKLKQDGYLHSQQGSGIFVNPPEFYEERTMTTLSERIEADVDLENQILQSDLIEANERLAAICNLPVGSKLHHYIRLRTINGTPCVLEETYMPQYLFRNFDAAKTPRGSVFKYIEEDCKYGISHAIKNVTAIKVEGELAGLLQMENGSATLQIEHKVYLKKSVLAQYTIEVQTNKTIRFIAVR